MIAKFIIIHFDYYFDFLYVLHFLLTYECYLYAFLLLFFFLLSIISKV